MPARIIKESMRTSERINSLSDFEFRLWVSLITFVDDFGRGDARPAVIKGYCLPIREEATIDDVAKGMDALAEKGCIIPYSVGGKPFFYFPKWGEHQTIRNKKSKFPAPDCEQLKSIASNCNQLQANVAVIQSNPIQSESERESNPKGDDVPTLDEVFEYCERKGYKTDPCSFYHYYDVEEWMIDGKPIHSWQRVLDAWERRFDADRSTISQADSGFDRWNIRADIS